MAFKRNKEPRPKREFRPQAHATVYLIALLYVAYLLGSMIWRAVQGGPEAPTGLQLALGVVVLGGGAAVLGVLTWHMLHLEPPARQPGAQQEPAGQAPQAPPEEAVSGQGQEAPAPEGEDGADSA